MSCAWTLPSRKNVFGEYVLRCYKDGKRYPDGDYFATDMDEATGTWKDMTRRETERNKYETEK